MRIKLVITLFLLSVSLSAFAREKVDKEEWFRLKRELRYQRQSKDGVLEDWSKNAEEGDDGTGGKISRWGMDDDEKYVKAKLRKKDIRTEDPADNGEYRVSDSVYLIILAIALLALLVVVYFFFFRKQVVVNKKIIVEQDAVVQVEKPYNELESLLSKAIDSENYREAIRIYFIFIIKYLKEKQWISWERKKTNTAYLFEMRGRKEYDSFSKIVLLFELIWYGKREINKDQFNSIRPSFDEFIKSIKP